MRIPKYCFSRYMWKSENVTELYKFDEDRLEKLNMVIKDPLIIKKYCLFGRRESHLNIDFVTIHFL